MTLQRSPFALDRSGTLGIALGIGLYIFLAAVGALRPLTDAVQFSFRPLQRIVAGPAARAAAFFGSVGRAKALEQENGRLQDALARALTENAQLRDQIENSKDIEQQLAFLKPRQLNGLFSQIIGRSPTPDHETLLLDRGSADGVERGAPIVVADGVLIGKIHAVSAHTATAVLMTDSQSQVAALLQNDARSPGAVKGERGLGLRMTLIPRQDPIAVGQTAVTSGLEPLIPQGLVIGRISAVTTGTGELFQSAQIEQIAVPARLRIVSILRLEQE